MNIRKMTPADIGGAAAIEATVLDGWSEAGIAAALDAPCTRCFVCEENAPAAFCAFTLVADEANLDALSVSTAMRRKGLAKALLTHAMQALYNEGARSVFLEVRSENAPAVALYEALGFERAGLRRGFYQKPADDAIIMTKRL